MGRKALVLAIGAVGLAGALTAAAFVAPNRAAAATPVYVPRDAATIVAHVPPRDPREVAERQALAAAPERVELAVELARADIQRARTLSDPRYLGRAQATLGRWWKLAEPPPDVLLLRATIEQSLHDFVAARADLDRLIAVRPDDAPVELYGDDAHIRQMLDLAVLALQCDRTRVLTYMLGNAGGNRPLDFLGIPLGLHMLSHTEETEFLTTAGRWVLGHWTYLVQRLAETPDVDGGRLLDNTLVLFVSEFGDGALHLGYDMPVLLAGSAALVGGAISMALGEYVSVSSQRDSERALIEKERKELADDPEAEFVELVGLYREQGLSEETASTAAASRAFLIMGSFLAGG